MRERVSCSRCSGNASLPFPSVLVTVTKPLLYCWCYYIAPGFCIRNKQRMTADLLNSTWLNLPCVQIKSHLHLCGWMRNEKVKNWTSEWQRAPRMMLLHQFVYFCLFSLSTHQMPSSHHPPQRRSRHREWRIQHRYPLPNQQGLGRQRGAGLGWGWPARCISPSHPWRETVGQVQDGWCSVNWVCSKNTNNSF